MRLKCLFCKYKAVCIPEQEERLSDYNYLQKANIKLVQENTKLENDYNDLYVKYENLKYNLQSFIRENNNH